MKHWDKTTYKLDSMSRLQIWNFLEYINLQRHASLFSFDNFETLLDDEQMIEAMWRQLCERKLGVKV